MTKEQQEAFIQDILKSFSEAVIEKVPHFPENWDGFEIRQYMLNYFKEHYVWTSMPTGRLKEFNNELLVNQKLY